jgi:two-component system, NarL family, response regulator DesR
LIRVLLALKDSLWRGVLAEVVDREQDMKVVAEIGSASQVVPAAGRERPDVALIERSIPGAYGAEELCAELTRRVPGCGVLMLLDRPQYGDIRDLVAQLGTRVGFTVTDVSPRRLLDDVRKVAQGNPVMDIEVAAVAMAAAGNPLTWRERDVLRRAVSGAPAKEIAAELYLSIGTVRNYLSRIVAKTGARTRIEAIRIAQDSGWI